MLKEHYRKKRNLCCRTTVVVVFPMLFWCYFGHKMRRVNHSFHRLTSYNPWQILSAGYNGFPPGTPNKDENWRKGKKDDLVVHAEANTVLLAGQADLEGSIAFVTMYPCRECAKMLIAVSDVENIRIT